MALETPPYLQVKGYDAKQDRQVIQALSGYQTGVVQAGHLTPTVGSGTAINIAAGYALIMGTSSTFQGAYVAYNNATQSVSLPLSWASSGQARLDQIFISISDQTEAGSGSNTAVFTVVNGSPQAQAGVSLDNRAGAGVSLPASAIRLCDVRISDSSTGSITIRDRRPWAKGASWQGALVGVGNLNGTTSPGSAQAHPPLLIDPVNFNPRMELSGLYPVEIMVFGQYANFAASTAGTVIFEPFINSARTIDNVNGSREQHKVHVAANSGLGAHQPVVLTIHPSQIPAGSYRIGPAWSCDPNMSVFYGYPNPSPNSPRIWVKIRELINSSVSAFNGSS